MADDTIKVDILTDVKSSVSSVMKYTAAIGGAYLAVSKMIKASKQYIDAYRIQEQAEAKLRSTLKATGNAAGFSFDQLKNYASGLQSVTTYGDEAVISGLSVLSTFKSIRGEAFERTAEAALDLSAVMGQDLQSSMVQLGKAVADPTVGLSALSRVGVTFTQQEKDQIKALQESNQLREAQAVILTAVEGQFKGAAKALAETDTGKLDQLNNALGDLKESAGQALLESTRPFITWLTDVALKSNAALTETKKLRDFFEKGITGESVEDLNLLIDQTRRRIEGLYTTLEKTGGKGVAGKQVQDAYNKASNELLGLVEKRNNLLAESEKKATEQRKADNKAAFDGRKALEEEEYNRRMSLNEMYILSQEEYYLQQAELDNQYVAWKADQLDKDMQLEKDRADYEALMQQQRLEAAATFFNGWAALAELGAEKSFALAVAFKALASAEAAINSYLAFTKALASAPWPFNIAAASGVLAAGLAQQIKINATPMPKYAQGGDFITSGPQAIMVGDNATGRERVSVEPLGADSSGNRTLVIPITLNGRELGRAITKMSKDGTIITSARSVR